MEIGSRKESIMVRAGITALTFIVLVAIALIAAPLSLEAPYLGILVTGSDSAWVVFGWFAAVLVLAAVCARAIVRAAIRRWPGREKSFRIGVLAVPVMALCALIVPLTVDWPPGSIAILAMPATFAVAVGAATAWIAVAR